MSSLEKNTVTEVEAAGQFVVEICRSAEESWPSIAQALNQLLKSKKLNPESKFDAFEFGLVVIATQI